MKKDFFFTKDNRENSKDKGNNLTTESDSKISINFNINNNYLMKNQIGQGQKSDSELNQDSAMKALQKSRFTFVKQLLNCSYHYLCICYKLV